jgi:hypothetical protein
MILAIFIDCEIYSCLLYGWQVPCTIHHDIKFFPRRRWAEYRGRATGTY